jgi:effector-binding domain-containing protein
MTVVAGFPIPEAPRAAPEQVRLVAVPTAVVRRAALTMDGVRGFFDAGFAALAAAVAPAGPAFAIYRGDPSTIFDAEIGFPVTAPLSASVPGEPGAIVVDPSSLPPGPALALSHVGGYDTLPDTWARLMEAVTASGAIPGSTFIEVYVTEPGPGAEPAAMRTELFAPLPG